MPALRLDMPVQYLKGIGERRAEAFERLGVFTVHDLLLHLPHRYLDASSVTPMGRVRVGDDVACVGTVLSKDVLPTRKGLRIFRAVLSDASGVLECSWPGQAWLDRTIEPGQLVLVAGPVRFYHGKQMTPREVVILADAAEADAGRAGDVAPPFDDLPPPSVPPPSRSAAAAPPTAGTEHRPRRRGGAKAVDVRGRVLPVYPATEGLSHKQIRALVAWHLDDMIAGVVDLLPERLRTQFTLPSLQDSLHAVHRPETVEQAEGGRRRLALDELIDLQLMMGRARLVARQGKRGTTFTIRRTFTTRLRAGLPWPLTADQKNAIREIFDDMTHDERMHRLVMGDVGTGKTVVALFAMLLALENGYQAALMAPTELLAEQHYRTISRLVTPLGLMPELLLGRLTAADKQAARRRLATGETHLVIGTHALVQDQVEFERLGLVVIDEQHRFGVEQRAALMHKGDAPDVLLLTATPIPRSLALTRFGDLDLSILRDRPPGRGTIRTALRTQGHRRAVFEFVRQTALGGGQAYVVLPVIDESERADLRAAETMATTLTRQWPDVSVGLAHGRLKPPERDRVMRAFRDGELQVLVATTVIEVGIDVPNATVMVIEHPERFGLAQLHQLRGRVGRGPRESTCILLAGSRTIPERLRAFAQIDDGFRIAELDLRERHQGDLLGSRQSGGIALRIARLPDDQDLLTEARALVHDVLAADPSLKQRAHRGLKERALIRYPRAEVLFRVG